MLSLLQSKNPGLQLDHEYLERLKTLPPSLVAAELEQLTSSSTSVSGALSKVGVSHSTQFAGLASVLSEIAACGDRMSATSAAAKHAAHKAPSQPTQVYSAVDRLLSQDIQLYSNLGHIQDLIEVPSLVQTCIDAEMYSTALDLGAFVGRVQSRYPKSTAIRDVGASVEQRLVKMRDGLVKLLSESSKLQAVSKAATVLRKLEPFRAQPRALDLVLKESRLLHLRSQLALLAPLASSSVSGYVRKYVEVYRENVGTALTVLNSVTGSTSGAQFVRAATRDLGAVLREYMPQVRDERPRVFLQLTFCSYSLGRLGVEFWGLLDGLDEEEWVQAYRTQQELSGVKAEDKEPQGEPGREDPKEPKEFQGEPEQKEAKEPQSEPSEDKLSGPTESEPAEPAEGSA